jgi:predicted phosphodiesterase
VSNPYTYGDPILSLWQSAVAEVHRRHASVALRMSVTSTAQMPTVDPSALKLLMAPADQIGALLKDGKTPDALFVPAVAPAALGAKVPVDCAKVAAEFLWAEIKHDTARAAILSGELKDAVCDVGGWAECLTVYAGYKAQLGAKNPYLQNKDIVIDLGTKTKIAIIGDWGTGAPVAVNLLQEVAKLKPDVLVHLGDIYYAGTMNEAHTNFLDICRVVLGVNVPIFSLCGNHDMYSGGAPYYWLVGQIGQQSSYFCLQNADWQFLAMDTGNNDNSPLTVNTNMTSLPIMNGWSEADWHLNKIAAAGSRKTVLFSHHQLFSAFGSVGSANGKAYAYNPNLLANFQNVLPKIQWWFWGHEHTLAVYDPYMTLQRGRCVGASAVPVFTDQQSYTTAQNLQTQSGVMPTWNAKGVLGTTDKDYNNCFAMMTLNGSSAGVDYYQVPLLGQATRLDVTDEV